MRYFVLTPKKGAEFHYLRLNAFYSKNCLQEKLKYERTSEKIGLSYAILFCGNVFKHNSCVLDPTIAIDQTILDSTNTK